MRLSKALRVEPGQVIAFVGAGGKSSAIRKLVDEQVGELPVLVTTSTKLGLEQSTLADQHEAIDDAADLITALSSWKPEKSLLLTGPELQDEPKWKGLPEAQLQDLIAFSRENDAVLLIEADGAAGRSLKAPAEYEPVLLETIDMVVPVVGIDALGERVDGELIQRTEQLSELLDLEPEARLKAEHIAALLTHPSGGLKSVPSFTEVRVLINKVSSPAEREQACQIAGMVICEERVRAVVITEVQAEDPVHQVRGQIAAVVLAAGESKRFDGNKLLVEWRGRPVLEHVLEAVRASEVNRRVLVLGHAQEAIHERIDLAGFECIHNQDWSDGQSSSVLAGLKAVEADVEAVIYPLGDMPLVEAGLINKLIERHVETLAPIIAPRVEGEWGNPVLFDRATFPAFSDLTGDRGAKMLFSQFAIEPVDASDSALHDVDRPEDLSHL